ncbi:DUF6435 family protein [Gimesia fumaroli]|jgi:hypothetical protein|uniref:Lacal_2735 family protein n=1 Tax=Gimesia fumaroli TaxID=2527976 RepID=A0A518I8P5_9PLAN|nr:DUF6435 family protein [Gimesia fumaroli]QDV49460.1 hypothetical protein Enr17x_14780 [Gimesia fumaroli]
MFGWLRRDPKKKLELQYAQKLEAARDAQRNGDIQSFATLTSEAEEILKQIDRLAEAIS